MNTRLAKVLAVLICIGTFSIHAMDTSKTPKDGLTQRMEDLGSSRARQLEDDTVGTTFRAVTAIKVVDYASVSAAKGNAPQVVSLEEVKPLLIQQHEESLPLYRRYPKTTLLCVGGACFTLGLFFPEIKKAFSAKLLQTTEQMSDFGGQ